MDDTLRFYLQQAMGIENIPMKQIDVRIVRYCEVRRSRAILAGLDSIFFAASATTNFASTAQRTEFRQRWLGNYLLHRPQEAFLALDSDDSPAGYLVGSLVDPASDPLQAGLDYFQSLAPQTRHYPAHLHVNLAEQYRSHGVGTKLVEAFCTHASARGAPGVHIVTGQGMRNVGFYQRCGFVEVGQAPWQGRTLVMLGRGLG